MDQVALRTGIVRGLRWVSVPLVALAIQAIFAVAITRIVNALPDRESLSTFPYGFGELVCVGIASFVSGAVAPNRRALAALLGGGSILCIDLLGFYQSAGSGSSDQNRGGAGVIAFGFVGTFAASVAWLVLDRARKQATPLGESN